MSMVSTLAALTTHKPASRVAHRALHITLFALTIGISLAITGCAGSEQTAKMPPKAIAGVLDLRDWDFEKDGPVDLSGEWEFYWEKLYQGTEPGLGLETGIRPDAMFEVPGVWNNYTLPDGTQLTSSGYATLRLRVLLPEVPLSSHFFKPLRIYLKTASTAYSLQVLNGDGQPLAETLRGGIVGTDPSSTVHARSSDIGTVPTASEWLVVWHISNFDTQTAGPYISPRIGSEGQLDHELYVERFANLVSIGILLVMGVYHWVLFALRPRDKAPLWFGLLCLELAARALATEHYLELLFPRAQIFRLVHRVEVLSFYLGVPTFTLFLHSMFPAQAAGRVFRAIVAIGVVFSLITIVTPITVYRHTIIPYELVTVVVIVWVFYVLGRAIKDKNRLARMIAAGSVILAVSVINDLLYAQLIINSVYIAQYGLSVFILFQAGVLAVVNQTSHNTAERLAVDLAQSEQKYRALFEDSRDAIFISTPTGEMIDVNQATLDLFGYTLDEMMRLDVRETFADRAERLGFQQAIEQAGSVRDFEVRLLKKDGTEMDCLLTATIRWASDGNILAYQGIVRDITERKQAQQKLEEYSRTLEQKVEHRTAELLSAIEQLEREITDRRQAAEALRESEERYRALFDQAYDAIILEDDQEKILDVNRAVSRLFGYTRAELLKMKTPDLEPPKIRSRPSRPIYSVPNVADEEEGAERFETVLLHRDGTQMPVDITIAPFKAGKKTLFLSIVRDITERKQTEEALRQQNEYLAALHETALGLVSHLDINDLLETLVTRAGQLLGTPHGYVYLAEATNTEHQTSNTGGIELERKVGTGVFGQLIGSRLRPGEGLAGKVWQDGQPLVIDDYDNWPGRSPNFDHNGIRAIVGVPLTQSTGTGEAGTLVVGVIGMAYGTESDRVFEDEEIELLGRFAELASIALDNARLFDVAQRRAQEAETLRYAGAVVAATLRQDEAIEYILQELARVIPYDSASVQLLNEGHLEIVGGHGWPDPQAVAGLRIPVPGDNPNTVVIRENNPYILADAPSEYAFFRESAHSRIRSWLGVPLIVRDQTIGILTVDSVQPNYFTRDHARLATAFADQVAIAIENARLFGEAERRVEELATLTDVGQALSSTLRVDEALQLIYEQTRRVMYAENMIIMLYDEARYEIECGFSNNLDDVVPGARFPADTGLTGYIIKHRESILLRDSGLERYLGVELAGQPSASWLGVPMLAGERVLGVIIVQHYTTPDVYDESHQVLLETVASQAAIAIQNARLFEEVQREKQYSESLVLNSPTAIVVEDIDHNITSWNPAAEKLFGYTQTEALGCRIDDLITTEAIRAEAATYTRQSERGQIVRSITQRSHKDGTMVDVELLGVPLVVEDERVGTLAIYHDITELQRARQEAEAANRAKSAFLATMSHEIRTPMNGVIGMTSLLLDTDLTSEQREFTETIRTSGDTLLTIINDILDFSKIEAGRMELEYQPFDLRDCVESALDLLTAKAAEKGLEIACLVDDQVPAAIVGDVTRLRQILTNLLNNAVKFTEEGEVVVQVASRQVASDTEYGIRSTSDVYELHFSVRDTGIGIPPDRMDRLFQSFSQMDASTTRKYGGTGLGLVISKRLSELMGGTMWAESPPSIPFDKLRAGLPTSGGEAVGGVGSTFHFTIQAEAAPVPTPAYLQDTQPDLRDRRMLIVDDNATNRRILTLQAQSWGMIPRDTSLPAEALDWVLRGDLFDVAVLDIQMQLTGAVGDMDGLTLAGKIRQERDAQALPIVLLSSLGLREAGATGNEFGPYLTKPVRASQLYDVLVEIFGAEEKQQVQQCDAPAAAREGRQQFDPEMGQRLPLRILLAEDNAVNQKLALRLLERMGYRADVAGNGLEALEALQRQTYDVVLMDVQMPEMDGLEATRRIRTSPLLGETEGGQQPRIIAMTANAMKEDREVCLAAGMDDYISKPIHVEELVRALNQCRSLETR